MWGWKEDVVMTLSVIGFVLIAFFIMLFSSLGICELVAKSDAKNISSIEAVINGEKVILTNIDKIYYNDTSVICSGNCEYKLKEFKVNKIK